MDTIGCQSVQVDGRQGCNALTEHNNPSPYNASLCEGEEMPIEGCCLAGPMGKTTRRPDNISDAEG